MESKIILFEGSPGLEKSALMNTCNNYLKSYFETKSFSNGEGGPLDLAFIAAIPIPLVKNVLDLFPKSVRLIKANMKVVGQFALIKYDEILSEIERSEVEKFRNCMIGFEVYEKRISMDAYVNINRTRVKAYAQRQYIEDDITLCDNLFVTRQIDEMMLFRKASEPEIIDLIMSLCEDMMSLYPTMIYFKQMDIEKVINFVKEEGDGSKQEAWYKYYFNYVKETPYGISKQIKTDSDFIEYFRKRELIVKNVLNMLSINSFVIKTNKYDMEDEWDEVKSIINKLYPDELG